MLLWISWFDRFSRAMFYMKSTCLCTVVYLYILVTIGGHVNADYHEFIANSGSTVTFNCYNTHDTYDNITWWRNDSLEIVAQKGFGFKHFSKNYTKRLNFDDKSKNLMIFDCQGSDHGFYFCETMSGNEKLRGGYYKFVVEEKPSCDRIVSDLNVLNGTTAFLPCYVRGTPTPNYQWHKIVDKKLVNLGSRFSITEKGLSIRNVSPRDAGSYRVKLVNKVDTFYHTVLVFVKTLKSIATENFKSVHLGTDVHFSCEKSVMKKGTTIKWITSNGEDATITRRFSISKNGSLLIKQVQLTDDGLYTCKKRTKVGSGILTKSILVYMNVQYAPVILAIKSEVYKNSHIIILCSAKGNPSPRYRWLLPNGVVIKSSTKYELLDTGSLIVRDVKVTDAFKYTCVPYNAVGEGKPASTQPSVIPPYFVSKHEKIIRARVGDNVKINCMASAIPQPSISWEHTNTNTSSDNQRKIMNRDGLLSIENVKRTDAGVYVCSAQSASRKKRRQVELIILNKPDIPLEFSVTTQNGSMQFSWKPGYDGGVKQTYELWFRATYKTDYQWSSVGVISTRYQIHLQDTNTAGEQGVSFYCSLRSENSEGYSDFSHVIKTSKLLPNGKKLSSTTLESPLAETPLPPYRFTVGIYEDRYELKWKYILTPGRPASTKFVIEYRETNSTSDWKTFSRKERVSRSLNAAKGKQNFVNIKTEDIPGVTHPLQFQMFSLSSTSVKSKPAIPIVEDMSTSAIAGKKTASVDTNLIPPIVMGVIFGLFTILIIIGLYCYCERKKKRLATKESKASLVANDNNNLSGERNSLELRDSSKLLIPESKDIPTRYHFSTCPALKLGESSHSTDRGQPDDVFVLLQPNAGENAACTCSKKYVTLNSDQLKKADKKRSLYKSSSLPSVLFTSDADVSSVDPSDITDGRDYGTIDLKKDSNGKLDKDTILTFQRGGLFRDSYDKFCRSESKDASRKLVTKIPATDKRNLNKLPETDNSSPETPLVETEKILRREVSDDDQNPETKSIKSNKSIDGKSSGFGDGDSSTSDPDSIELDAFVTPTLLNNEKASHLLNTISKKDTGYFSDVPASISPLFISNHKFHPIQKHKVGNKSKHSGYFSEDETVTRLPYRPLQPPSYNQAIIDIERMSENNDITDSENMCKQLLEMERKMGVKLDDSIENNLDKVIIEPPSRFQNSSYIDTGYMSDVTSTLKTRYSNKEKNERCAQLLNEFKINRQPIKKLNFTEGIVEEELPPPGSTPKHLAKSISVIENIISEEPLSTLKRSNSTNSNIFNEWLV